ncbi:hypothetical protein BRC81_13610 [Halobacteriales archaeon QS_1_68_20]|nr:MAG: hypothetical protein BRC81_13610 [Halobacteriales archaeon QS_1_68_20]
MQPTPYLYATFYAMFDLGFGAADLDCVASEHFDDHPYATKLAYRPVEESVESFDSLELFCRQGPDGLAVEVDAGDADPADRLETVVTTADRREICEQFRELLAAVSP